MSLVGPRPERPEFVEDLTRLIPYYGQRHVVRPGITGWAQVRYTYGASTEDALQKLQYDLYLHQELVDRPRLLHHLRHDQDRHPAKGRVNVAAFVQAPAGDVVNAMSVDVEDYFQVNAFDSVVSRDRWENLESRVTRNTDRLLGLFEAGGVTATFFVLGWVAERFPSLVAAIAKQGHEVASHGYAHRLIYNQTPEAFRDDVRRAKDLLESATGVHVDGFRAPSYSITERTLWALDVLIEEGYRYDASIFPIRHDRYGMPSSPRHPHVLTRDGGSLVEAPASTVRLAGMNLPVAGGGYFRIFPYAWTRWGIRRINRGEGQSGHLLSAPVGDRSGAATASTPGSSAGSVITATWTRPSRGCAGCCAISGSRPCGACWRPFIRKRRALRRRCGWRGAEAAMTPYTELAPAPVSPDVFTPVPLPAKARPQLFVIVDTEEEFDWSAPFSRSTVGVTAIQEVGRLQHVLTAYGVAPTYVIDYPVATTPSSVARLGEFAVRGECHIGAHLHPWVNPPYVEELTRSTSYACNLGHDLEHDKIAQLRGAIIEHFGVVPRVYKAGRYGFGQTTAEILESLGFDVDASVNPHMDFRADGGPSFEGFSAEPSFFGKRRRLLELPCTMGFVGAARRMGPALHRAASTRWLEPLRAVGVLARSGALNKVMLSPEGNTLRRDAVAHRARSIWTASARSH